MRERWSNGAEQEPGGMQPGASLTYRDQDLLEQEEVDAQGAVEEQRREEAVHEEVGGADADPVGEGVAQLPGVVVVAPGLEDAALRVEGA